MYRDVIVSASTMNSSLGLSLPRSAEPLLGAYVLAILGNGDVVDEVCLRGVGPARLRQTFLPLLSVHATALGAAPTPSSYLAVAIALHAAAIREYGKEDDGLLRVLLFSLFPPHGAQASTAALASHLQASFGLTTAEATLVATTTAE